MANRILIVDDHKYIRSSVIKDCGNDYEFIEAASGEEALQKLCGIDLAIVDLGLPGISGIELIEDIKKRGIHIPVLTHGKLSLLPLPMAQNL